MIVVRRGDALRSRVFERLPEKIHQLLYELIEETCVSRFHLSKCGLPVVLRATGPSGNAATYELWLHLSGKSHKRCGMVEKA